MITEEYISNVFPIVAVAFFYSSMSVLEGKPEEAVARVQAVRSRCPSPSLFSLIEYP